MTNTDSGKHTPSDSPADRNFRSLINKEEESFKDKLSGHHAMSSPGEAHEPWVSFRSDDRIGLALSGGGIRSATFNLGVLQALEEKGFLGQLHYLSTVSGGGYVGGFWTRWRNHHKTRTRSFPMPTPGGGFSGDARETPQIRHLREFSRFLIPRQGLNAEFWSVAITLLSGLIPSLIATLACVFLVSAIFGLTALLLTGDNVHIASIGCGALMTVSLYLLQRRTQARVAQVHVALHRRCTALCTAAAGILYPLSCYVWIYVCGCGEGGPGWRARGLFIPPAALLITLAVMTILRLVVTRACKPVSQQDTTAKGEQKSAAAEKAPVRLIMLDSLNRTMGYLLGIQATWILFACLWLTATWLCSESLSLSPGKGAGGVGGLTAVMSLIFYKVRDWLKAQKGSEGDSTLSKLLKYLKPWVPLLLANGIVLLLFLLAAIVLLAIPSGPESRQLVWWMAVLVCTGLLLLVFCLFDPSTQGLHEFYRSRLARCYLGAAAQQPTHEWAERHDDDMPLSEDADLPVHLICCAANQSSGDQLPTLHRGARSAVLSRNGISVGEHYVKDGSLRLSSAMTASAAAFNSLMGEYNVTLGHAVPFVMTALNLRLGLWVPNPAVTSSRNDLYSWFPGTFFLRELLGVANCDSRNAPYIHLSDGGHFENLAVYELIRRHCRYIVVSDAGADPEFAFTDFGRAVRRVREDFGVEVEIDLSHLRPDENGCCQQHLVVGVIHYDGVVGTDKGTLVYIKSALTGDEPIDVLQYQKQSSAFPHESTGDQFFDEAQFESYRRLGEHTVHSALRCFDGKTLGVDLPIENFFHELRQRWQVVPWIDAEAGVRLCERGAAMEAGLNSSGTPKLGTDFLAPLLGQVSGGLPSANTSAATDLDEVLQVIQFLRFMEEAFVAFSLDRYWSSPRAQSWMSLLHRYAALPAVRRWWPAIKCFFGESFTDFANQQLHLESADVPRPGIPASNGQAWLELKQAPLSPYLSRRHQECHPDSSITGLMYRVLILHLPGANPTDPKTLQVGFVAFKETMVGSSLCYLWNHEDLFIPPELKGGSFTSGLLDRFLIEIDAMPLVERVRVLISSPKPGGGRSAPLQRGHAARQATVETIDFYRSRRFSLDGDTWNEGLNTCLEKVLKSRTP